MGDLLKDLKKVGLELIEKQKVKEEVKKKSMYYFEDQFAPNLRHIDIIKRRFGKQLEDSENLAYVRRSCVCEQATACACAVAEISFGGACMRARVL